MSEVIIKSILPVRMPCIFHVLTGLYCPGCGGTRALESLLSGHLLVSFFYHPLVLYCAVLAVVFVVSYGLYFITKREKFRLPFPNRLVHIGIVLTVLNFIIKNAIILLGGPAVLDLLPPV